MRLFEKIEVDTEKDSIENCIDNIDDDHTEDLHFGAHRYFDNHQTQERVTLHIESLKEEKVSICTIVIGVLRVTHLIIKIPRILCTGSDVAKIRRSHPDEIVLYQVPYKAANNVSVDDF